MSVAYFCGRHVCANAACRGVSNDVLNDVFLRCVFEWDDVKPQDHCSVLLEKTAFGRHASVYPLVQKGGPSVANCCMFHSRVSVRIALRRLRDRWAQTVANTRTNTISFSLKSVVLQLFKPATRSFTVRPSWWTIPLRFCLFSHIMDVTQKTSVYGLNIQDGTAWHFTGSWCPGRWPRDF